MFTFIHSAEGQALGLLWSLNSVQPRLNLSICKIKRAVLCCFGIVRSFSYLLVDCVNFCRCIEEWQWQSASWCFVLWFNTIVEFSIVWPLCFWIDGPFMTWRSWLLLFSSLTFMIEMQGSSVTPLLLLVFLFMVINLGFMHVI